MKSLDDLQAVIDFFEERRGRLHGFRWKYHADYKSCRPRPLRPEDQPIGTGDGRRRVQLVKLYGASFAPWSRESPSRCRYGEGRGERYAPIEGPDYS